MVALADLAEAEGRTLRRQVGRVGLGLVLFALAGTAGALGLGLALWACFLFFLEPLGVSGAAAACSLLALSAAGLLAWVAKRLTR